MPKVDKKDATPKLPLEPEIPLVQEEKAGPTGTFKLQIGSILPNSSYDPSKDTIWAYIHAEDTKFWWTESVVVDDTTGTESNSTPASTPRIPVNEDLDKIYSRNISFSELSAEERENVELEFTQSSKAFVLNIPNISKLINSSIKVCLYKGETRDRNSDELLGEFPLPMADVIISQQWEGFATFRSAVAPVENDGQTQEGDPTSIFRCFDVNIKVECDCDLADFATGSRLVSFDSFSIAKIPSEWRVSVEEGEDLESVLLDRSRNNAVYHVSFADSNVFPGGSFVLCDEGFVTASKTLVESKHTKEDEGQEQGKEIEPSYKITNWRIEWANANLRHQFLYSSSIKHLEDVQEIKLMIKRSQAKDAKGVAFNEWYFEALCTVEDLFTPGAVSIQSAGRIKQGRVPSRESFEHAVSTAQSNDAKKRAQAALDDYENLLSLTAGQAAVLVTSTATLGFHVSLSAAIVQKDTNPVESLLKVTDIVPTRNELPPYPPKNQTKELQRDIQNIVYTLLKEYEKMLKTNADTSNEPGYECMSTKAKEEKRKEFIFNLNKSGIYFEFKESLKKRIAHVVREKFPQAPQDNLIDENNNNNHPFYSELYVYLMEQVSSSLNTVFAKPDEVASILSRSTKQSSVEASSKVEMLKVKAWENESNQQPEKAMNFHMERIYFMKEQARVLGGYKPSVWYEFGMFCLRQGYYDKAREALHQSLAIDPQHLVSLRAYGALLCELNDFVQAEIILKNLLAEEERSLELGNKTTALSHALLGLYFDRMGNDKSGNLCKYELMNAKNRIAQDRNVSPKTGGCSLCSTCIVLSSYLEELRLMNLLSRSLELLEEMKTPKMVLQPHERFKYRLVSSKLKFEQQEFGQCVALLKEALEIEPHNSNAWFQLGKSYVADNRLNDASEAYAHALNRVDSLTEFYKLSLYLNLGGLYLQSGRLQLAKEVFLRAAADIPLASTWLGVGVCFLRQEDWKNSELAFAEANILDPTNAEIWGYLALLCFTASPPRMEEGMESLQQTLRQDLKNASLLREIGNLMMQHDQLQKAEALFRRSLVLQDSAMTRQRLADVLSSLNLAEEALREYQVSLNSCEDPVERARILEQCVRLLTTLGRVQEAEEYSRMAGSQAQQRVPHVSGSTVAVQ